MCGTAGEGDEAAPPPTLRAARGALPGATRGAGLLAADDRLLPLAAGLLPRLPGPRDRCRRGHGHHSGDPARLSDMALRLHGRRGPRPGDRDAGGAPVRRARLLSLAGEDRRAAVRPGRRSRATEAQGHPAALRADEEGGRADARRGLLSPDDGEPHGENRDDTDEHEYEGQPPPAFSDVSVTHRHSPFEPPRDTSPRCFHRS